MYSTKYIVTIIIILFQLMYFSLNCAFADPKLPEIPKRPSITKLKEDIINENKQNQGEVRIRNFPNTKINVSDSLDKKQSFGDDYDNLMEETLSSDLKQLFALTLRAIKTLNLKLKYFNINDGEIIVKDRLYNTFVVQISNHSANQSKVKILAYGSRLGRYKLEKTSHKLLAEISEKTIK